MLFNGFRRHIDYRTCLFAEIHHWKPSLRIASHQAYFDEEIKSNLKKMDLTDTFSLYYPESVDVDSIITTSIKECLKKYLQEYDFHFNIIFEDKIYLQIQPMEFFKSSRIKNGKEDIVSIYQFYCLTKMIEELSHI